MCETRSFLLTLVCDSKCEMTIRKGIFYSEKMDFGRKRGVDNESELARNRERRVESGKKKGKFRENNCQ